MNMQQKRLYVRDALDLVVLEAQKARDGYSLGDSSLGLVAAPGGSEGHSGRTSDFTAVKALAGASDSTIDKKARDWYGLASDAYVILRSNVDLAGDAKTPGKAHKDKLMAYVFFERVMNGKKIAKIAFDEHFRENLVTRLYARTIDLCLGLAESRGMIPD